MNRKRISGNTVYKKYEPDTIKLLRECDAGIKMGTASIADVLDKVNDTKLKEMLENCKDQHQDLQKELESLLEEFHDDGKEPNPMAQGRIFGHIYKRVQG